MTWYPIKCVNCELAVAWCPVNLEHIARTVQPIYCAACFPHVNLSTGKYEGRDGQGKQGA